VKEEKKLKSEGIRKGGKVYGQGRGGFPRAIAKDLDRRKKEGPETLKKRGNSLGFKKWTTQSKKKQKRFLREK